METGLSESSSSTKQPNLRTTERSKAESAQQHLRLWLDRQADLSSLQVRQYVTDLRIYGASYGSLISAVVSARHMRNSSSAGLSLKRTRVRLSREKARKAKSRNSLLTALWHFGQRTGSTFRSPLCRVGKCDCRMKRLNCTVRWSAISSSSLKRWMQKSLQRSLSPSPRSYSNWRRARCLMTAKRLVTYTTPSSTTSSHC